jgi:N-acetylmuramoyl-L-alanine amidase
MKSNFALRTLCLGLAWLFLQNFNASGHKGRDSFAARAAFAELLAPHFNPGYKIRTVVLDAGHGGKDPGCIGTANTYEKHNTLAIVLKLGALIEYHYPEVRVIYTRDEDVFVELNERAAIANRNNADLFVSVHCNALSVSSAKGTETYVMGLHKAQHNLEVAKRENASIFLEEGYQKNYEGYDPDSPEAHIIGSVWQSAYLEQSILFAGHVQKHAQKVAKREDRGVKQAGFLVLRETAMPSVLVESGYMTNAAEEAFLLSEEGRDDMALAIFYAFEDYKKDLEGNSSARSGPAVTKAAKHNSPAPAKTKDKPKTSAQTAPKPTPAALPVHQTDKVALTQPVGPEHKGPFRVLLLSWPSRMDRNAGQLGLLSNVQEEIIEGKYHYFVGTFASRQEADTMLSEIKNLGFRTAFLTAAR